MDDRNNFRAEQSSRSEEGSVKGIGIQLEMLVNKKKHQQQKRKQTELTV